MVVNTLINYPITDILRSLPCRVWIMDMIGRVVWDSADSAEDESLLTSHWWDQVASDHSDLDNGIRRARSGEPGVVEFRRKLPSKEVWVRAKCNPMWSPTGDQIGVYGVESDVTTQRETLPKLLKLKTNNMTEAA